MQKIMKKYGDTYSNEHKVPVKVRAAYEFDGVVTPKIIYAEPAQPIVIDAIRDVRQAVASKAGGQGIRYTCRVGSRELYLFHDRDWWFLEVDDKEAFYVWALSHVDG